MAYRMNRGNSAVPFKELGSSPAKQKTKIDPDAPGTPGTPGYEPEVKSTDYLTKTPSIVATDLRKKEYNQSEKEQEKESDEETKRINRPPATRPPTFSDADAHRKTQSNLNKKKHPLGIEDPAELEKLYKKTETPRQ